jgi:hypothetical protein
VITLTLGIGANTAIFSVVNAVLLNPLPFHNASRIVSMFEETQNFAKGSISYPNFPTFSIGSATIVPLRQWPHTATQTAASRA